MFTAKDVVKRASWILKDTENVRWSRDALLGFVNEGQAAIARLAPQAVSTRTVVDLKEGTVQDLPADSLGLITVNRNVDQFDQPGSVVRVATRSIFDAVLDDWHMERHCSEVENYFYDDRDGKHFEVFPPNDGFGRLDLVYAALPKQIGMDDAILGDEFFSIIVYYVLYKAATLDSDYNGTAQLAQSYYQLFLSELTGQDKAASQAGPLPSLQPATPVASNGGTE